jgi:hypothetical protein
MGGHTTNEGSIFVASPNTFENDTAGFVGAITNRYTKLVSGSPSASKRVTVSSYMHSLHVFYSQAPL